MRCSSEVGNSAGGVSEKKVIQSATSSSQEGASLRERQSTASKCGARRFPSKEASMLLPMPPIPSSVTRRQRSCTIHWESSATSTSRPAKWLTSSASTQSTRRKTAGSSSVWATNGWARRTQADGGAQRQHQLSEGIVSLTVHMSLHERSPDLA